jgi:outer membrane protein OmpA-like peptidoglycan-associated protein
MKRSFSRLLAAGGAAVLLTSCTTINPYTREEEVSKATKGAAIGAVAGAAVGALTGDDSRERRKRALIGAGIGALAGGGVGYYMDVQEAKLRQKLERTGVSVTRVGDEIVLNMPANVTFEFDRADLKPGFFEVLGSVALVIKEYEKTMVEVSGHTDSTGPEAYNQQLSERRADTVARYLAAQGVLPLRVFAQGIGEHQPVASNSTAQGRALNRRVELRLVPIVA